MRSVQEVSRYGLVIETSVGPRKGRMAIRTNLAEIAHVLIVFEMA
jgi:hypothetical protein